MAHSKTAHLVDTATAHPATFLVAGMIAVYAGALEGSHSETALITLFIWLVIAPIAEELVFRGVILEWLSRQQSYLTANVFSSLLFAMAHYLFAPSLLSLATFIPSIWFGLLYLRNRSVVHPICAHVLCNLAFTVGYTYLQN